VDEDAKEERGMARSTECFEWRRAKGCSGGNCVEVAKDGDVYLIRDTRHGDAVPLRFTSEEWEAFARGVREGDFQFD
jgi:hypothetical protein